MSLSNFLFLEDIMEFLLMNEELAYYELKYQMNKKLEQLAISKGYQLIEPSFFEDYDDFIQRNKRIKKSSMVKLIDLDGSVLVLRPDITTSIIKHVIPKYESGELKLFYLSTIFSRGKTGRIEEKKQFGIEYLGCPNPSSDLEVITMAIELLKSFDMNFVLEISTTKFLSKLISNLKITLEEENQLKNILYTKNQYELDLWLNKVNLKNGNKALLKDIFQLQGNSKDLDQILKNYHLDEAMTQAIDELKVLFNTLEEKSLSDYAQIDLTVLSTYDYYDGFVFKGYVQNISEPILSGGRYDPLTLEQGKKVPAIGFTLNSNDLLKEVIRRGK
jgi:ATP phosphoribosyltransferase regulatory subunit